MSVNFFFEPINLRLNRVSSKIAVTQNDTPTFSWGAEHSESSQWQSEAKIKIYCEKECIYDSGWLIKKEQEHIYDGPSLPHSRKMEWSVTLRDNKGRESKEAKMGFLYSDPERMHATWITKKDSKERTAIYFTHQFQIGKKVKRAVLNVSGLGYHKAFLNGVEIDEAVMQPSVTSYNEIVYYVVNEISGDIFSNGENVVGIILADGWRANYGPWCEALLRDREVPFMGTPELYAQLELFYEDGTQECIITDESWLCIDGATEANIFDGESYDARKEKQDWKLKGLGANSSENAIIVAGPGGKLLPQFFEPVRCKQKISPLHILRTPDGFLCDFGVNIAGVCEIEIPPSGSCEDRIVIKYAEEVDDEHCLNQGTLRWAKAIDTYVYGGNETQSFWWKPQFTYHGFRYALISGINELHANMVNAVEMYNDIKNESSFICGSPIVNAIQNAIVRTEKNNIHNLFTDCPQRDERMGWMNDSVVRFEQVPYNFDIGGMFPKVIYDEMAEQSEDGEITCTAPFLYGYRPADPVCSAYIVAGMQAYYHTGNKEILKEAYPSYKAWCKYLLTRREDGILTYSHYGDWAAPVAGCKSKEDPHSGVTPPEVMSTGFLYYNYTMLTQMATLLGEKSEVEQNRMLAEEIKERFCEKWVDKETGIVATGSMGCQTLALRFGLLDDVIGKKAAKYLHELLVQSDYSLTTGNLTTKYIYDVLTQNGYVEDAWKLITREEYPSLGYMISKGATSIWERFEDKENSQMNSHDHPMYGAVGAWFYEVLAGIKPIASGFEKFEICPHFPEKLNLIQACVDSVKGKIYVKWIRKENGIHLYFTVPFGTQAVVKVCGQEETFGSGMHHKIV